MKVKEIVSEALVCINAGDKVDVFNNYVNGQTEGVASADIKLFSHIKRLAINCLKEIAVNYTPFIKTERMVGNNGFVPFSQFTLNAVKIIKAESEVGVPVHYTKSVEGLYADKDVFNVTYCYMPSVNEWEDEVCALECGIPLRAISCLTAGEYFIVNGDYTAGNVWRQKFCEYMSGLADRINISVKRRRWV